MSDHVYRLVLGIIATLLIVVLLTVVAEIAVSVGWWLLLALPIGAVCYLVGALVDALLERTH